MRRTVLTGVGLGALSALRHYCLTYVYLAVVAVNNAAAAVFAVVMALFFTRGGTGRRLAAFLIWLPSALLFLQLLPTPDSMYRSIHRAETSLSGGGGCALMVEAASAFFVFSCAFGTFCAIFHHNNS